MTERELDALIHEAAALETVPDYRKDPAALARRLVEEALRRECSPPEPVPDTRPFWKRPSVQAAAAIVILILVGIVVVVPVAGPARVERMPDPEPQVEGPPPEKPRPVHVPDGPTPSRVIDLSTELVAPDGSKIRVLGPNRALTGVERLKVSVDVATSRSFVLMFQIDPETAAFIPRDKFTRGAGGVAAGSTMCQPAASKADEVFVLIAADPETAESVMSLGAFVSPDEVQEARHAADPEAAIRALVLAGLAKAKCDVPAHDVLVRCGEPALP